MATKKNSVNIKPIGRETVLVTIKGITPLVQHAWDEKAKRMILDKQRGKKVGAKHEIKIPVNDFINSMYWLTPKPENGASDEEAEANFNAAIEAGAKFAFPVTGIKQSIITGAYRAGLDVTQTELRGAMRIEGATEMSTADFAEIVTSDVPKMREDMVRVGGRSKSADIRYRAEFTDWEIPLNITYHKDGKYTLEQILNMINYGGWYVGIGEWRPEKDGQMGMYELKA